jgi:5-formyltetrahydrofolate cyclo-ligase
MDKSALREQAKFHRDRIARREEGYESAARIFFEEIKPSPSSVIAGYWPKEKEFDVRHILADALERGMACCLPVITPGRRELTFRPWDEKTPLKKAGYGLMEPEGDGAVLPDILLVPLLAFDRRGHRLGYGKGYYDATLAALRAQKDILAIGVGYAEQAVLFNLPAHEFDQTLDMMLTPQGLTDFRNA